MGVGGGVKKMTNVALKAAEAKVIIGEKLKTIFDFLLMLEKPGFQSSLGEVYHSLAIL